MPLNLKSKTNRKSGITSKRHPGGFTLIEVMIAMAIFAVGIMAVFSLQITAINQNAAARIQTEATTIGVQHMELLMALPYDDFLLSADESKNPHQQPVGGFTLQWTVKNPAVLDSDPDYDGEYAHLPLKFVNLTVTDANPNARPVEITFIRGQRMQLE